NRGAPGPDGQTIDVMREHLEDWMPSLKSSLLEGSYMPGDIRRVWIPKAGGGQRGLGIPNVIDRVVQEAVRQVLEPMYESDFHASSHGFRPGRSCQTAVAEAVSHVEAILRNLVSRGTRRSTAWRSVYGGRKSTWALSHTPAVDLALRNSHWDA